MARRLICALAALARAYDWTTPDAGLTPFKCTAFPNPIQVLLADGQKAPYNVSELDLATGRYTKICPNGFPGPGSSPTTAGASRRRRSAGRRRLPSARAVAGAASAGASPCSPGASSTRTTTPSTSTTTENTR